MITQIPSADSIPKNPSLEAARGNIPGQTVIRRFARGTVTTSETLVGLTGASPVFQTSAAPVRARAGGNANDSAAGTGARTILVSGLDTNFNLISETITLTGASVSAQTTQSFRRVNFAYVASTGVYRGSNTGEVVIENTSGVLISDISAGAGQSNSSWFCVPSGYAYYVVGFNLTAASSKEVTVYVNIAEDADDVTTPFTGAKRRVSEYPSIGNNAPFTYTVPLRVRAKTDIWVSGFTSSTTADISVEYVGVLIEDGSP